MRPRNEHDTEIVFRETANELARQSLEPMSDNDREWLYKRAGLALSKAEAEAIKNPGLQERFLEPEPPPLPTPEPPPPKAKVSDTPTVEEKMILKSIGDLEKCIRNLMPAHQTRQQMYLNRMAQARGRVHEAFQIRRTREQ